MLVLLTGSVASACGKCGGGPQCTDNKPAPMQATLEGLIPCDDPNCPDKHPAAAPKKPQYQNIEIPFEELSWNDDLPDYVYSMPRRIYQEWAKAQNKAWARKIQRDADEFNSRNPQRVVYEQESDYDSTTEQETHETATPRSHDFSGRSRTNYDNNATQRDFMSQKWSGGPMHVLNPYAKRPAKLKWGPMGVMVMDPDGTLDTQEKFEKFMKSHGFEYQTPGGMEIEIELGPPSPPQPLN